MKRLALALTCLGLAACQSAGSLPGFGAPKSAADALESYYRTLPDSFYPEGPAGKALPGADQTLTRILVASCLDEEKDEPSKVLQSIARSRADLFLMIGDNVYGDRDGRGYSNNQAELDELRESFTDLAARADFRAVRRALPMMVAWDDHDYGANDVGADFPFRFLSERIHERFWGLDDQDVGAWPGTYYARTFGPIGQRTQVIMLDTRFFRSKLTPTDEYGKKGKERYLPSRDPQQDMLGTAQWTWLENQLQQPADLRLIVSSVQVLPGDHGWEAWSKLPAEQAHLYDLIRSTGAKGVVFVSGDRHQGFLYQRQDALPYPVAELTASSVNLSFNDTSTEYDRFQIGAGYALENYGAIDIDWPRGQVRLSILNSEGRTVRQTRLDFR